MERWGWKKEIGGQWWWWRWRWCVEGFEGRTIGERGGGMTTYSSLSLFLLSYSSPGVIAQDNRPKSWFPTSRWIATLLVVALHSNGSTATLSSPIGGAEKSLLVAAKRLAAPVKRAEHHSPALTEPGEAFVHRPSFFFGSVRIYPSETASPWVKWC